MRPVPPWKPSHQGKGLSLEKRTVCGFAGDPGRNVDAGALRCGGI